MADVEIKLEMPAAEYHAIKDRASASMLRHFARSPAHAKVEMDTPMEQTRPMLIGESLHRMLEIGAESWALEYVVRPADLDGRTKAGKAWLEDIQSSGLVALTEDEAAAVRGMAASVNAHPTVKDIMAAGRVDGEVSVFWTDEETGCPCKARFDVLCWTLGVILDYKTTDDASREAWRRAVGSWSYYHQADLYLRAPIDPRPTVFGWVPVEKKAPHCCGVYTASADLLAFAHAKNNELLTRYRDCLERNEWPGYDPRPSDIDLPKWVTAGTELPATF